MLRLTSLLILASLATAQRPPAEPQQPPDFGRDIRPLLADRCFACHGPDASSRQADLRLDTREGATRDLGGRAAIVPGDHQSSELWRRITATDADQVMPPAKAHKKPFTDQQRELLRRWIAAGAPWSRHWAFVPPIQAALPGGEAHPVDAWIVASLAKRDRSLAEEAPRHTLLRRLSFDLTGLPPQPEALSEFGDRQDLGRYVEQLLASPHHAERLAMWWLDAARYADTDGFQADAVRDNWPWRDWVVAAFAQNMPFDRFTELQFAGDLLPDAGPDEVLATCFHRNHMHNGEGGRDPEESRVDYVRDRVNTTGAVWMGLTMECAQCHDHKFDPISQDDYYAMSAFFNSIDESGKAGGGARPFLAYQSKLADHALQVAASDRQLAGKRLQQLRTASRPAFLAWLQAKREAIGASYRAWHPLAVASCRCEPAGGTLVANSAGIVTRSGQHAQQDEFVLQLEPGLLAAVTGIELEVIASPDGSLGFGTTGDFILTGVRMQVLRAGQRLDAPFTKAVASHDGKGVVSMYGSVNGVLDDDPRTGWRVGSTELASTKLDSTKLDSTKLAGAAKPASRNSARARLALGEAIPLQADDVLEVRLLFRSQVPSAYPNRLRVRATSERGAAAKELRASALEALSQADAAISTEQLPQTLIERLHDQFLLADPEWVHAVHQKRRLDAQVRAAKKANQKVQVTVLAERKQPRTSWILERGEWDKHGKEVTRHFPTAVFPQPRTQRPTPLTRLDLARWLTSPSNPLTSRVIVNQVWQMLFGQGLVATPDDFGLQGQAPTHPRLLDWLAVDFVESGWDLRHLIRTIVTSRAYRQASTVSPELLALDPDNQLLARGPRYRLPSWMIRDASLAASGLLDRTVGGPPIYPHQPDGVWAELFMGRFRYQPTIGRARHRRTLYAFWRRNAAPTFLFDHADRRSCAVVARRTNTPLQSLTLLNDRTFAECARLLAARALAEHEQPRAQIRAMAMRVIQRDLRDAEAQPLLSLHRRASERFARDPGAARQLASGSALDATPEPALSQPDALKLAALTAVASVLFNLDEAITHE